MVDGQGCRERTGDGDDVLNVDDEGGGLRAPVEHTLDVVVGDDADHGEHSRGVLELKEEEEEEEGV